MMYSKKGRAVFVWNISTFIYIDFKIKVHPVIRTCLDLIPGDWTVEERSCMFILSLINVVINVVILTLEGHVVNFHSTTTHDIHEMTQQCTRSSVLKQDVTGWEVRGRIAIGLTQVHSFTLRCLLRNPIGCHGNDKPRQVTTAWRRRPKALQEMLKRKQV